ncbi:MAG TPA: outer membrane beta-barrel protein [Xanthobacteraceae bacterium]|nr:outer membrane beta-barrel protein [Xanthobacteraceae bacterium]
MKFDRSLLAAGAIAATLTGGAADAQTSNGQSWSGIYGGINGGYAWGGDKTVSFTPNDGAAQIATCGGFVGGTCPGALNTNLQGGFGGLQVGYNRQVDQNWVLGVEIDFNLAAIRGSGTGTDFNLGILAANFTGEQEIKWFATFRGRVGYLATPGLLLFGTAGLAVAGVDESSILKVAPNIGAGVENGTSYLCHEPFGSMPDCFKGSRSRTATGWTAGGGFEYAVMRNLTVKTEYLYVGLDRSPLRVTALVPSSGLPPASFSANFGRPDFHLVRFGLNYNFGGCIGSC